MISPTFIPTPHTSHIRSLSLCPLGKALASGASKRSVTVWSFEQSKRLFCHFFNHDITTVSLCLSPASRLQYHLFCVLEDGTVALLEFMRFSNFTLSCVYLKSSGAIIHVISCTHDLVVCGGELGVFYIWRFNDDDIWELQDLVDFSSQCFLFGRIIGLHISEYTSDSHITAVYTTELETSCTLLSCAFMGDGERLAIPLPSSTGEEKFLARNAWGNVFAWDGQYGNLLFYRAHEDSYGGLSQASITICLPHPDQGYWDCDHSKVIIAISDWHPLSVMSNTTPVWHLKRGGDRSAGIMYHQMRDLCVKPKIGKALSYSTNVCQDLSSIKLKDV
ncbi:hypothetical protein JAAARDRAFT_48723 [Jaapia argillacea MUCL 33604]|uniref:Uncharacterized protein n=1 Tax=Jaapia argillacea MUCL 33604 TaxID=933084 RepID=A0A067PK96_9AGAM|nr:hypothetical protein JAAARDRAFT_48723 [Jaapia argillacea MUCL 33604]